jgi:hypothetical protein
VEVKELNKGRVNVTYLRVEVFKGLARSYAARNFIAKS